MQMAAKRNADSCPFQICDMKAILLRRSAFESFWFASVLMDRPGYGEKVHPRRAATSAPTAAMTFSSAPAINSKSPPPT